MKNATAFSLKTFSLLTTLAIATLFFSACGDATSDSVSDHESSVSLGRLLFVASGSCYAGGVTTSTGVSTIVAYALNGTFHHMVIDYNRYSPGDSPVSLAEYDADTLLVLVENASGRRIDLVKKDGSGISTYLSNTTALSAVLRSMARLNDNSLVVSKTTAIERFSSAKARITQGANPYVSAPAGSCATSTTLIPSITVLNNGKIVYAHAAATPNNKIGVISAAGYAAASDCLSAQTAPTTLAMPTSLVYHSSGKLLASYASTTAASNFVYAYDVSEVTGALTLPVSALNDISLVNGPSAMAENPATGEVFIANGNSSFNTVERFTFNPASKTLTRVGSLPFLAPQAYTRCIADMKVLVR